MKCAASSPSGLLNAVRLPSSVKILPTGLPHKREIAFVQHAAGLISPGHHDAGESELT